MEDLDKLAADFAAGGYQPDGAELRHDEGAAGRHHGEQQPESPPTHGAGGVRRFAHRGHEVQIVTHYEVLIDGERWEQHLEVLDDGAVTYHGLPQYANPSAVELVCRVIDYEEDAPEDLRAAFRAARAEA